MSAINTSLVDCDGARLCRLAHRLLIALLAIGIAGLAEGANYYFSSIGNDTLGDGSLANPWRSIARFNQLDLNPGDSALFRAGDEFTGKMFLDAADAGTGAAGEFIAPVRIGSYGAAGTATRARIISPPSSEAFVSYNNGGVELSDLEFVSGGTAGGVRTNGVHFLSDISGSASLNKFNHIRVSNIVSHGFGLSGLQVWAHRNVGYADVQVTGSEFYNNGYAGVYVGGTQWHDLHHANVVIDRVVAHHNPGFSSNSLPYTGHGVLLAQTDGGVIQNSVAHNNGLVNGRANVAIWTYGSNNVVIQHNLAYSNRSPGGDDGAAFDIDGGTTNSVIQYNRSYDNDGAGLLLAQFNGSDPMSNNVFRYNLSVNDGRDGYGGITIFGHDKIDVAKAAVFHNNTIVVDRSVVPDARGAVWFAGPRHSDITLINNAFIALNGAPLIAGNTSLAKSSFVGNSYWTDGGPIILEDRTYAKVRTWAITSRQEQLGGQIVAITEDPAFVDSESFQLSASSPLLNSGLLPGDLPWPEWISSLGNHDLGGLSVFQGSGPDIGAWEFPVSIFGDDGEFDAADYVIWRDTMGSITDLRADHNRNRVVDLADYEVWKMNFGTTTHQLNNGQAADAVPEQSAIRLLICGLFCAFALLKRCSRMRRF